MQVYSGPWSQAHLSSWAVLVEELEELRVNSSFIQGQGEPQQLGEL